MIYSKILICVAMTCACHHMARAAPMNTNNIPAPILHLDDNQIQQFKQASPDQSEPDIAFPKDADGIYAIAEEVPVDSEALEMGIELHSADNVELKDTMEDVVLMEEDSVVSDYNDDEEEVVEEEDETAAPADLLNTDENDSFTEADSVDEEKENDTLHAAVIQDSMEEDEEGAQVEEEEEEDAQVE